MGFPTWTLWGMGLSAFGALIAIALALLAQTPRLLSRFGLIRFRFDLRARSFTVYGFALLLLSVGFFLAGVPLGSPAANTPATETSGAGEVTIATEAPANSTTADNATANNDLSTGFQTPLAEQTPATITDESEGSDSGFSVPTGNGATIGLPGEETGEGGIVPTNPAELVGTSTTGASFDTPALTTTFAITSSESVLVGTAEVEATGTATPEPDTSTPTALPSATSATTTTAPTETPIASPTVEPTATPSPTPIDEPTAVIGAGTSTLWIRRTPGGQNLALLSRGDRVILLAGHANYGGRLWQEVRTLDGVLGWVQEEYLEFSASS
jgi:hypothetical protein